MLPVGCVVEVFAAHVTPPHRKYFVVTCLHPRVLGFFINSEINQFIQRRPSLLAGQVQMFQQHHPFLRYDSWMDCSEAHTFAMEFLEREVRTNPPAYLGTLAAQARTDMLDVIRQSYTLPEDHIIWICAAFGVPRDPT